MLWNKVIMPELKLYMNVLGLHSATINRRLNLEVSQLDYFSCITGSLEVGNSWC